MMMLRSQSVTNVENHDAETCKAKLKRLSVVESARVEIDDGKQKNDAKTRNFCSGHPIKRLLSLTTKRHHNFYDVKNSETISNDRFNRCIPRRWGSDVCLLSHKRLTSLEDHQFREVKKNIGGCVENPDAWVAVQKLKSQSDGGILDVDDRVCDVADDREQIIAIFEEDDDGIPGLHHNAGDGTSASSVGTSSPDCFHGNEHKFQPFSRTDIEVRSNELLDGKEGIVDLQVRRGSEPALNRLSPLHLSPSDDPSKRWSAAPVIEEDSVIIKSTENESGEEEASGEVELKRSKLVAGATTLKPKGAKGDKEKMECQVSGVSMPPPSDEKATLIRNSVLRTSEVIVSDNDIGSNVSKNYINGNSDTKVKENSDVKSSVTTASAFKTILTSSNSAANVENSLVTLRQRSATSLHQPISRFSRDMNRLSMQILGDSGYKWADAADRALSLSLRKDPLGGTCTPETPSIAENEMDNGDEVIEEILLAQESGPLGIQVVPHNVGSAKNQGLIIQGVEPGGRVDRDGRLQALDKIIEVNGSSLMELPFQEASELFRESLTSSTLKLKVIKNPVNVANNMESCVDGQLEEKENMVHSYERYIGDSKVATVSSAKKMPLQTVTRPIGATTSLIASNTRKMGRKYEIDLQKGPQGLGFSITTRDNPAGGNSPFYIKNILPTGAAIEDGRLRPGDRLLEVNGNELTGKSQGEVVAMLRNIPQGGFVKLMVSRQERVDLSPKLPRQIPPDKVSEDFHMNMILSEREISTLEIPVLDTEKAGLGISVKGKTTASQGGVMMDMGIFIKSVIHGGAASRDGRLRSNDQLLNVNGVSLLDRSNTEAMETLRRTMTQDGPKPKPGFITLTIARRVPSSSAPTTDMSACGSSASGDEMDSWGSKNVSVNVDELVLKDEPTEREQGVLSSGNQEVGITIQDSSQVQNMIKAIESSIGETKEVESQMSQVSIGNPVDLVWNRRSRSSSLRTPEKVKREQACRRFGRGSIDLPRNPVLDRLSGKSSNPPRNESYYKATADAWSPSFQNNIPDGNAYCVKVPSIQSSYLFQNGKGELIVLEDDYAIPPKPPRRSRSSTPDNALNQVIQQQTAGSNLSIDSGPNMSSDNNNNACASDVTYASQTSLEEAAAGFSRDAFGRQSMSEKRHATLDAKNTDTYQRNRKVREEREKTKQVTNNGDAAVKINPAELARERNRQDELARRRGIKRPFSSYVDEDIANRIGNHLNAVVALSPTRPQSHYYETMASNQNIGGGGVLGLGDQLLHLLQTLGPSKQRGRQTSKPAVALQRVNSVDSLVGSTSAKKVLEKTESKDKSLDRKKGKKNKEKKKKDIGPSLGMKKSSSLESLQTMVQEIQSEEDAKAGFNSRNGPPTVRVIRGRGCNESFRQAVDRSYEAPLGSHEPMETLAEEENDYMASNHLRYEKKEEQDNEGVRTKKKGGIFRGLGTMFRFGRHRKSTGGTSDLRRRNRSPHGQETVDLDYRSRSSRPQSAKTWDLEDVETSKKSYAALGPYSESVSRDMNGNTEMSNGGKSSGNYDLYSEMNRPGSRVGFVDPSKPSHYINYDEIRYHLNDEKECNSNQVQGKGELSEQEVKQMRRIVMEQRKKAVLESRRHQQHYHSQRRENPRSKQDRPVSNFYEYESVQAAIPRVSSRGQNNPSSNPQHNIIPKPNTLTLKPHQQQGVYVGKSKSTPTKTLPHPSPQHGIYNTASFSGISIPQPNQMQNHSPPVPSIASIPKKNSSCYNQGITLPSPCSILQPYPMSSSSGLISSSQFQAGPIHPTTQFDVAKSRHAFLTKPMVYNQHQRSSHSHSRESSSSSSMQKLSNSLPRRSTKDLQTKEREVQMMPDYHGQRIVSRDICVNEMNQPTLQSSRDQAISHSHSSSQGFNTVQNNQHIYSHVRHPYSTNPHVMGSVMGSKV